VLDPLFIAVSIAALGFLIVVHEGGHYFVGRWCKMRIERFSIGFGPAILKRQSKTTGTTFQLAPIPFGGFVEIRGMNIAEEVDPDDRFAYPNRPVWQRFVTIFAGPATNYLSALVLALGLYTCHGVDVPKWYGVGTVMTGYDAAGKLESGDRITAVNGTPLFIDRGPTLVDLVNAAKGGPLALDIERDGAPHKITIQPRLDNADTAKVRAHLADMVKLAPGLAPFADSVGKSLPDPVWRIGVRPEVQYLVLEISTLEAVERSLRYPVEQTKVIGAGLYGIVFGDDKADPGGPVRIVEEFYRAFSAGIVPGIKLLMVLSVYLGLFNLLPLPALDGGRLVFLAYEMVTRRRANPKIESMVHMAGIMALGVLMLLVFYVDIKRLFT
jgi:regulator of sigma E protease